MNNEETILKGEVLQNEEVSNSMDNAKGSFAKSWKPVTIGGVTGILVGAGALVASQHIHAGEESEVEDTNIDSSDDTISEAPVAYVSDDMSFSEAFASARDQVGPGGVFQWHGGVFSTYTADEWQSMSDAEHQAFADQVHTSIDAHNMDTSYLVDNSSSNHSSVNHGGHSNQHATGTGAETDQPTGKTGTIEGQTTPPEQPDLRGFEMEGVRIIGFGENEGHRVIAYDANDDSNPDVVLIDVDDDNKISPADVLITEDGQATIAELYEEYQEDQAQTQGDAQLAQNPDVAPDGMPDYMNDGMIDV